jgi:hypothetical protein
MVPSRGAPAETFLLCDGRCEKHEIATTHESDRSQFSAVILSEARRSAATEHESKDLCTFSDVILSEARRSAATERESKDLCTLFGLNHRVGTFSRVPLLLDTRAKRL